MASFISRKLRNQGRRLFPLARRTASSRRASSTHARVLTKDTVNEKVIRAEYAVRGAVVSRALELEEHLLDPTNKLPFDEIIYCNIGNPHQLGQQPITYARQVLALLTYPQLMEEEATKALFPSDVIARAKAYMAGIPGGTGAYSHSQGVPIVRDEVAAAIAERDGCPASPDNIFLTDGASPSLQNVVSLMIQNPNDGIMLPVPEYPLYSASVALAGGNKVDYFLNEESGWELDLKELTRALKVGKKQGINVRGIIVTNPGNPTGQCLSRVNMEEIVQFCVDNRLVLLADEVYQENIWQEELPFVSFKKVASEMGLVNDAKDGSHTTAGVELISFHSVSKGYMGECGRRGGYMEVIGCDPIVHSLLYKLSSVNLCSNVDGQVMVGLMSRPPTPDEPSYALFDQERKLILESLHRRAHMLGDMFGQMEGVSCQVPQGALYIFPQITLSHMAVTAATAIGMTPDAFYCMQMVEATGIVIVPGTGFGQRDGTHHFRTTILPQEDQLLGVVDGMKRFHEEFMNKYR